jgi:hypothetical protein
MAEKTIVSGVNAVALGTGHLGYTLVGDIGLQLIDVPAGKNFYLTGIYGVAGVAGQIVIYDSEDGWFATEALLDAATKLRLYISTVGDGITDICIGPFTKDVWLGSDATATTTDIADIAVCGYLE